MQINGPLSHPGACEPPKRLSTAIITHQSLRDLHLSLFPSPLSAAGRENSETLIRSPPRSRKINLAACSRLPSFRSPTQQPTLHSKLELHALSRRSRKHGSTNPFPYSRPPYLLTITKLSQPKHSNLHRVINLSLLHSPLLNTHAACSNQPMQSYSQLDSLTLSNRSLKLATKN